VFSHKDQPIIIKREKKLHVGMRVLSETPGLKRRPTKIFTMGYLLGITS